jgi:CDP-diacylglycerol--serine O-phosphatidyltransferase
MMKNGMRTQGNSILQGLERPAEKGISHKRTLIFKQLRALRWPDMLTLLGLLCVSFSVYFSFKGLVGVAYVLILVQLLFDYFDGKLARRIGGGVMGVFLDSFSDFMAVSSSVVLGWFVGINGNAMLVAGFLNVGAAAIRLAYFMAKKQKGFTGVPTVIAASAVSTLVFLGYVFIPTYLVWFVVFYFVTAVAMISDFKLTKLS